MTLSPDIALYFGVQLSDVTDPKNIDRDVVAARRMYCYVLYNTVPFMTQESLARKLGYCKCESVNEAIKEIELARTLNDKESKFIRRALQELMSRYVDSFEKINPLLPFTELQEARNGAVCG